MLMMASTKNRRQHAYADDDYDTNENEMRIFANRNDATVQHLLDETAFIISDYNHSD